MAGDGRLDLEEIRAIIRLAAESDISELIVDAPHVKVHVKKASAAPVPAVHVAAPPPVDRQPAAVRETSDAETAGARYVPIVAPMVGTFYRAPKPDAPPFVVEGDTVQTGQTVCVLEAMKLFNEIPSEVAGRIVRVLVENGAPVEYGQPLFLVDPTVAS